MLDEVITGGYAFGSLAHVALRYQDMMLNNKGIGQTAEKVMGVELYVQKDRYHPPVYIGTGGSGAGIGIPVGGGTETEFVRLHSKFTDAGGALVYKLLGALATRSDLLDQHGRSVDERGEPT